MFMQAGPLTTVDGDVVPLAQPFLNGRELELVGEVVRSGQLVRGPMLERFEQAFAAEAGVAAAVAVSSRHVGVHAMATAAAWTAGDQVLVSAFVSSVLVEQLASRGVDVVQVDVDRRTMSINAAMVEQLVGERTRAVIDCARFGSSGGVDALHGVPVLRESGAVHGDGTRLVTCCDAGIVMAGGGAVLCTDDLELAGAWRRATGDARLAELAGAVGVAQLEKLPRALGLRSMIAAEYDRMIADVPGVVVLPSASSYVVLVEEGRDVDAVSAALAERGIDARRAIANVDAGLPVAASVAARALAVPFFPAISPQQQERVVRELRDVLAAG